VIVCCAANRLPPVGWMDKPIIVAATERTIHAAIVKEGKQLII